MIFFTILFIKLFRFNFHLKKVMYTNYLKKKTLFAKEFLIKKKEENFIVLFRKMSKFNPILLRK